MTCPDHLTINYTTQDMTPVKCIKDYISFIFHFKMIFIFIEMFHIFRVFDERNFVIHLAYLISSWLFVFISVLIILLSIKSDTPYNNM